MAYPNPIKTTGALSTGGDIFEYFKGATQALLTNQVQAEYISVPWTSDFRSIFGGDDYPITRNTFNIIIQANFSDTDDLLFAEEPESGWVMEKVNDWAKVQSIMLAVFGSRTGSPSQTSLSYLTGPRSNTSGWNIYDMNLLRFALSRFDSYGACYPESVQAPPPTSPVVNIPNRTFNWTNAPGYNNLTDYRYSINNGMSDIPFEKPIVIPNNVSVPVGGIKVWTFGGRYLDDSDEITNSVSIPSVQVVANLTVYCYYTGSQIMWSGGVGLNRAISSVLTISGTAQYQISGGSSYSFSFSVSIPNGETSGNNGGPIAGGPVGTVTSTSVLTANAFPSSFEGQPIIVNY